MEMRGVKISMFNRSDMERVHEKSLQLLAENGMNMNNRRALEYFRQNGFRIDGTQVYFTEAQVTRALETIPSHFVFQGRDPRNSVDLGSGVYAACTPIGPVDVHTLDGGKRPGTLQDVENLCKIYQASDVIRINTNNGVEANDIKDDQNRHFYITRAALRNTDKPFYTRLFNYREMNEIMDMMEICCGEKLEKGGRLWMAPGSCPSLSPMGFDEAVLDALVALAERGQIVTLGNATTTGVTGPIQIMGNIVMQNAEQLAGMVLTQLINPGNATGYGVAGCPANMNGAKYCCGSPGRAMLQLGVIQMAKEFYHMPVRTEPNTTDSPSIDVQCGIEMYEGAFASILGGADYMLGEIGTLDSLMTVSYEKTILDEEVISRLLYIRDGIDVSEDACAVETVKDVGSGGTFLLEDDTLELMRDAWYPTYTSWNRDPKTQSEEGYEYAIRKANAEWKKRLEEAPDCLLDAETAKDLDKYIESRKH